MRYEIMYKGKKYRLFRAHCKKCDNLKGVGRTSGGVCFNCLNKSVMSMKRFGKLYPKEFFTMTNNELLELIETHKYVGIRRWREAERFEGIWPSVEV